MISLQTLANLSNLYKIALAGLSGALVTVALPPYGLWPAAFVGLSLFYVVLSTSPDTQRAFTLSWGFGFGYFTAGLWWIANALLVEGNPFSWVWPLAVAGLPAVLALFPAFAGALTVKTTDTKKLTGLLGFILFFAFFEWLRGHIFTGFPWNLYGYIWDAVLPVAQISALVGIYGLTLLTLAWTILPAWLAVSDNSRRTKTIAFSLTAVTMLASIVYGTLRLNTSPPTQTGQVSPIIKVVQPNILQQDKWNPEKTVENLERLLSVSRPDPSLQSKTVQTKSAETPVILVWPETALTEGVINNPVLRQKIVDTLSLYPQPVYVFSGLLRSEKSGSTDDRAYYNSLAVFDKTLNILSLYDKSHLVPFGEFIPLQEWLPLAPFVQLTGFTPGEKNKITDIKDIPTARPLICYEIIFPAQATGAQNRDTPKAKWLINVTNDAWYGRSPGPYQHFAQARFRAIEQGIPVVRSANTGISGIFDPYGRLVISAPLFTQESLLSPLPATLPDQTIYRLYGQNLLISIFITLFLLLNILQYQKKKNF